MLSNDLIIGARGAAKYIGTTERAVYHLVEDGHLPVTRKGRRLYFRKSELDQAFSAAA